MIRRLSGYMREKYQSLIFRILLYFLISALAVALVLGWNFASRIKPRFENEVLPNLAQYIQYLVNDVGTPPDLNRAKSLADKLPFEMRIEGPGVDWASTIGLRAIDHYHFHNAPYPYQQYHISRRHRDHLLLVESGDFQYLFAVDSSFHSGSRDRHWLLFVLLGGILLLLYFVIRRLFQPLEEITQHLKKIGSGDLDRNLDIKGTSEIAQLGHGINQMSVEIKSMLESKTGLLLAISHELRSPLTRMRVNLELLEDNPIQATLIQDVQEMEDLVSGILESERLNTRHAVLNLTHFDLAGVIPPIIKRYFKHCPIETELASEDVYMDEVRIRLLIKNLIDNACRYSNDTDQPVMIAVKSLDDKIELSVTDHGPGVRAEEITRLTEPFYRTDAGRLRKTGGYGLGLYLCKLIVEAHQGRLDIQSNSGQGLHVIAVFPRQL